MHLTNILKAQHLGRTFKKHWQIQGKRVPRSTGTLKDLEKFGIKIKEAREIITPPLNYKRIDIVGYKPTADFGLNWNDRLCYVFGDNNVLLEGILQAQILTKSLAINGFPKSLEKSIAHQRNLESIHTNIKNFILATSVFDAKQSKLPKANLIERPGFNLPRVYGIPHERQCRLLINKLISECEKSTGVLANSNRRLCDQAKFNVTVCKNGDLIQLRTTADKYITSTRPLNYVNNEYNGNLPDLHPIKCTISIPKSNIYTTDTFYPLSEKIYGSCPHTIFSDFCKETVTNAHETAVRDSQIEGRSLLKSFATAAAYAKKLYGDEDLLKLPKPISVQCIQTDGRTFHFGVLQLNTLALDDTNGIKNFWFSRPALQLYKAFDRTSAKIQLENYNKDVYRYIEAFYNNS